MLKTACRHRALLLSLAAFDRAPRNINYATLVKQSFNNRISCPL